MTRPKMKIKSPMWYTVYSIISTLMEEALLVGIVLWILPRFNMHIPWWGLSILAAGLAIYAYVTYRLGIRALVKKPMVALDSILGTEGIVIKSLAPEGYVKVQGELWKARCAEFEVEAGDEVVVVEVDGLKLIVTPKSRGAQHQQVQQ